MLKAQKGKSRKNDNSNKSAKTFAKRNGIKREDFAPEYDETDYALDADLDAMFEQTDDELDNVAAYLYAVAEQDAEDDRYYNNPEWDGDTIDAGRL